MMSYNRQKERVVKCARNTNHDGCTGIVSADVTVGGGFVVASHLFKVVGIESTAHHQLTTACQTHLHRHCMLTLSGMKRLASITGWETVQQSVNPLKCSDVRLRYICDLILVKLAATVRKTSYSPCFSGHCLLWLWPLDPTI